jgi:single-strand DNA-binding protein
MSLVNISIVGNVIKPPHQHCFSSGKKKTTLVVAVDAPTRKKDGDQRYESDVYKVEAWGKLGDIAHQYLAKGSLVGATGRLVMSHWQDREGRSRVTPTVEADQIALPPKPKADSFSGPIHTNPVSGLEEFDGFDITAASADTPVPAPMQQSTESNIVPTTEPSIESSYAPGAVANALVDQTVEASDRRDSSNDGSESAGAGNDPDDDEEESMDDDYGENAPRRG